MTSDDHVLPLNCHPHQVPQWAVELGLDWRDVTTVLAVAAGEAAYWMVRTSTEVTKTALQANPLWVQRSAEDKVTKLVAEDDVTKLASEDDVTKLVAEDDVTKLAAEDKVTKLAAEDDVTKLASEDAIDRPALQGAPSGGGSGSASGSGSGCGRASALGRASASAALAEIGRRLSIVLGAYPVLALTDLPLVVTRTSLFLVLRANGLG